MYPWAAGLRHRDSHCTIHFPRKPKAGGNISFPACLEGHAHQGPILQRQLAPGERGPAETLTWTGTCSIPLAPNQLTNHTDDTKTDSKPGENSPTDEIKTTWQGGKEGRSHCEFIITRWLSTQTQWSYKCAVQRLADTDIPTTFPAGHTGGTEYWEDRTTHSHTAEDRGPVGFPREDLCANSRGSLYRPGPVPGTTAANLSGGKAHL